MRKMNNQAIQKIAVGSVFLLLLAGCGGGGGGDKTAKKAALTEQNASEAVGLGLVLDGFIGEFAGIGLRSVGAEASAENSRSASSPETQAEPRQRRADLGVLDRFSRKITRFQLDGSQLRAPSSSTACDGGGTVTVTETDTTMKINFDQCTHWLDEGYFTGWGKEHGTISVEKTSLDDYPDALKIAIDMKYSYKGAWYGDKFNEELTQKGSMTIGSKIDATKIADFNFDLAGKINYAGEKWNEELWVRNFNSTSETSGTTEVVKYRGTVGAEGSHIKLKGSLNIATDSQLNYIDPAYGFQFPHGQAINFVGADDRVLRVEFSDDGNLATVSLDGKEIRRFSYRGDYENWVNWGDSY